MTELRKTNLYRLIKNENSVRIEDIRTMELRIVDCESNVRMLMDAEHEQFDNECLEMML